MPFKDPAKRAAYEAARAKTPKRKIAQAAANKKWAGNNKDRTYAATKRWRVKNKDQFNATLAAWRKANPEKVRAARLRWQEKHGREYYAANKTKRCVSHRETTARELLANPAQQRQRRKRHYLAHKDAINSAKRADRIANPIKYTLAEKKRWRDNKEERTRQNFIQRGKRHGISMYCTKEQWLALLRQFDFQCFYCHATLTRQSRTLDHKIPLSRGGSNEPDNLVPCCRICNSRKHDLTADEFTVRLLHSNC